MVNRIEKYFDKKHVVIAVIAVLTLLVYCNSFTAPFTLDDFGSIVNNYAIRNPLDFKAIWNFYSNRFVLYFTLSLNYFFHGTSVAGYHITNVAIHILNGFLVYLIINSILGLTHFRHKLYGRYRNIVSMLSSFIFICHPVQVNAVTYIVQRTASLAAMFYFLAVFLFIKYRLTDKRQYFVLMMVAIVLAMFTKENTITIPFMLLVIELMFFLNDGKTSWSKRAAVFFIIFATVPIIPCTNLLLKGYSQSDSNVSFKASTSMDRLQYFYTQLNVIRVYIRQLFIPDNLNFDYSNDFPISKIIWDNYSYISLVILLIIGLVGLFSIRKNKLVAFGIFWFFIGLSVESSFISIKDVYFEHRLYLPIVGFIIFLAGFAFTELKHVTRLYLFKKPVLFFVVSSCCLICIYSGITLQRNYIFSDGIRLWTDVVKKAPASDRAHSVLGTKYLDSYEADKEKNKEHLSLAEMELKKAIDLNYNNSTAHTNLSKVYFLKGEYEKCIEEANKANRISKSKYAYHNLGLAYKKLGRIDEAIDAFLEGYKLDNKCSFILRELGYAYYEKKDYENARYYFEEYLKLCSYGKKNIEEKLNEINRR
ncbi:MAG TPA: tetratricopeptide repeat protein [Clostridiaceae bacterium]|nr:tetratricopeptide repeat protein [Clostridiaceae bacterium]